MFLVYSMCSWVVSLCAFDKIDLLIYIKKTFLLPLAVAIDTTRNDSSATLSLVGVP